MRQLFCLMEIEYNTSLIMKYALKNLQSLVAITLCIIWIMCFAGCKKNEPEGLKFEYYAPNAEGVHITEKFIGDGINIERTYLWVSHHTVLLWGDSYEEFNQNVIGGIGGYFLYYPMSLDKVEQFIGHYKVLEGEDNHVVDIITPTKEPILEYIKEHKYEYIASSPFYSGDIFLFNMISNEYYDSLERSGETIYNGDEDLR